MTSRGVVHTLDAFFAAVVIFTAILYSSQIPRESELEDSNTIKAVGLQTLMILDNNGTLGRLVEERKWREIEEAFRVTLPTGISFNLTIFDENGIVINDWAMSNGGILSRNVHSIEYSLVVEASVCPIYKLRLQIGGQ
jgi:hypothetical protein